jgi:BirA family biotin operon repressor/biotin-[acetyl-CoA-carboxylase] ligase
MLLRPQIHQNKWTFISLAAALAVHDALLDAYSLDTDIKWPNDILSGNRKLCGILAETVDTRDGRAIVLGIGINLISSAFPPELHEMATSVERETDRVADPETILKSLIVSIGLRYEMLESNEGEKIILREWSAHSSYASGKRVRVVNGREVIEGITRGLEPDGALRVETEGREIQIVHAGDVNEVRELGVPRGSVP